MSRSEILYLLLFIGVFPALWILAVVLDRFLPSNSSLYSPQDERKRQSERDELYTARPGKSPSGRQSSQQTSTKQGEKERVATLPRSKSEEAYRARAAAALVAAVRPTAPSLDGNRPMHPLRFSPSAIAPASSWTFAIHRNSAYPPGMKEHIYGYAAILATLLSLPSLAAKLRNDDHVPDEVIDPQVIPTESKPRAG